MNTATIEPEVIEADTQTTAVVHEPQQPVGFDTTADQVDQQIQIAEQLVRRMSERCKGPKFIANIQGRNFPTVEWWNSAGFALGLLPRVLSTRRQNRQNGDYIYEAVVAVCRNGVELTRADGMCSTEETNGQRPRWQDEYAVRSMAQTRATAKAYRLGLSFIATLAQLEPTPAEEVPQGGFNNAPPAQQPPQPQQRHQQPPPQQQAGPLPAGTARILRVTTKTGESGRGPWTKYGINYQYEGQQAAWVNTFSDSYGQLAQQLGASGEPAVLDIDSSGQYPELKSINAAPASESAPPPQAPAASTGEVGTATVTVKGIERPVLPGGGNAIVLETDKGVYGTADSGVQQSLANIGIGETVSLTYHTAPRSDGSLANVIDQVDPPNQEANDSGQMAGW